MFQPRDSDRHHVHDQRHEGQERAQAPPPQPGPSTRTGSDEAGLVGEDDRLDPVTQTELQQDPREVRLHRRLPNDERLRDLRIREATGHLLAVVVGLVAGTLVLAVSLWRTRVVPRSAAALIVAFVLGDTVAVGANSLAVYLVAHTFLLLGSGWIGLRVLRMSHAEWGSPPR